MQKAMPAGTAQAAPPAKHSPIRHALVLLACVYAALIALHTLTDFDLGWQLATGRWVVQHHAIPSTDLLSYTAQGQPWIYPVLSGVIFYLAYLIGGYSLLSCLGAIACLVTVALLLRRGPAVAALIAILAVPAIGVRCNVRADLFTLVLFAAFLSLLWENYETGRARLWYLPVLMALWVNLHLGFLFGLLLCAAYVGLEVLEILVDTNRAQATARLRAAWPWLVATVLATLLNPWGWGIYRAIERQQAATAQHATMIGEWTSTRVDFDLLMRALTFRSPTGYFIWVLFFAVAAALAAATRKQFGAVLLLAVSAYFGIKHIRFHGLFACVVVIVGGAVLSAAIHEWQQRIPLASRRRLPLVLVFLAGILVGVRITDLVTNSFYLSISGRDTFGPGLSWWFPERAAEFVLRNKIPAQIFNSYDMGGYVAWKLGPQYPDYIDGRAISFGFERLQLVQQLMASPPDSPLWQNEAERYNINTMIVPISRYQGVQYFPWLNEFCRSTAWRPVYLDEVSVVFVRSTPQTEDIIRQHELDCAQVRLPAGPELKSRASRFNQWANAAAVLSALERNREALEATDIALKLYAESGVLHFTRANIFLSAGDLDAAEKEFLASARLEPNPGSWIGLARIYQATGRIAEAQQALKRAEELRLEARH
ncbi:MAG TPA: tetratricopeptide repeat protein [Terriglobales bacterium]|nr:tetratricopeptide repeat protein [Terriglobales bacterium]